MFILGNFIIALANILDLALTIYSFIIIIGAVLSWVNPDPYNPIVRFIYGITEPLLRPIRKLLRLRLPIDLSPLILLLIIYFLQKFLIQSLIELGFKLKGGAV
ncbi:MAG: YggT family protein [Thermodesulfovibrio sp.]|uniref:YggT family protein n=1 Tax=unclassified Thermodesulfovibrio TaxID=2645936 RepID=UPI00083B26DF|nr:MULTISPECIES: YggT family protein [unclassified Thermodesulfovibrio]MDI1472359.1 YggT family protein [Thermodesulfovibrio sp. 1176]MDI6714224.1 YggT family protein [Thermodesulfovibrio sp.]ODA43361.1 Integral membrane protein YggT, involved in response to extracytoplasmic stress (osmotic shock) [Thermodesulfovibrio sp. N1]